ncbi:MAG: N-acetylmuramoyl-L-alanine amidase family protein, partial [Chitinophagaceae bacterium]
MMRFWRYYLLPVLCGLLFIPVAAQNMGGGVLPTDNKPFVVIIDPGHGGVDPGARGSYSTEAQVALAIGLKLGKLLSEIPNVKVYYTRTTDALPGGGTNIKAALRWRADFANRMGGNVFISIHCNSTKPFPHREFIGYRTEYVRVHHKRVRRRVPRYRYYTTPNIQQGAEVYVWGISKDEDKNLALRENAPLLNDPEYKSLFDSSGSALKTIFWNTVQREYTKQSLTLASDVENQFAKIGRVDRQVKQRQVGIWVLHATAMPSILIETGFINNPVEENYLNNNQEQIATCIYDAFVNYLAGVKGETTTQILGGGTMPAVAKESNSDYSYKIQLLVSSNKYPVDDPKFNKLDGKIIREKDKVNDSILYRYLLGNYKTGDEASQQLEMI